MYDLSKLGDRIKSLRLQNKKTQEEVAKDLGIKLNTYQVIESGRRVGRVDTLCMIADYFNTTMDYLLGNDKAQDQTIQINYLNLSDEMKILAKKQIIALLKVMNQ